MRADGRLIDVSLAIYAVAVMAFLFLPVLVIIPMSFNDGPIFEVVPSHLSTIQYLRLFSSPDWIDAIGRSIEIAGTVMVCAGGIGTLSAMGIMAMPRRLQLGLEAMFLAPQIVPSIVLAASSYYIFVQLGLVGSILGIVIMHSVLALPFVVVLVLARLRSLSPDLAQASASLGANPLRTFIRVTLPQLRLTLIGAAVLAFHVSFDEVVLALFLSGARTKTLPVKLWDAILFEVSPNLPAISALVILLPALIITPVLWFQSRSAKQRT